MLTTSPAMPVQGWFDLAAAARRWSIPVSRLLAAEPAVVGFETPVDSRVDSPIEAHAEPHITFVEPSESFLSQSLRGFALSVLTLGLYSFWARAESRRQLHRSIRVAGHSLDYTGTGKEGLLAFVVGAVTTVVVVSAFLTLYFQPGGSGEAARAALSDSRLRRLLISLPVLFLLGSVTYRKRKQVMRRTWWRGERFELDGEPYWYAVHHFWTALLVPVSLGWAAPWRASYLERRMVNETSHGCRRFVAQEPSGALYRAFAVLWFGGGLIYVATMVLLGLTVGEPLLRAINTNDLVPLLAPGVAQTSLLVLGTGLLPVIGFLLYYRAAWIEHQISSLSFDGVRFRLRLPKLQFAGLMLCHGLVKVVTLGALQPVANAALVRFVIARIETLSDADCG